MKQICMAIGVLFFLSCKPVSEEKQEPVKDLTPDPLPLTAPSFKLSCQSEGNPAVDLIRCFVIDNNGNILDAQLELVAGSKLAPLSVKQNGYELHIQLGGDQGEQLLKTATIKANISGLDPLESPLRDLIQDSTI